MKLLLSLVVLSISTFSMAADSSWLLCKGQMTIDGDKFNIVVNSLEHRAGIDDEGNDKRVNDLTLIFGNRLIVGQLDTSIDMNGSVSLSTAENSSKYDGIVIFDYTKPSLILRGKIVIDEELTSTIAVKMNCEHMN
jgi:hypothetical protein